MISKTLSDNVRIERLSELRRAVRTTFEQNFISTKTLSIFEEIEQLSQSESDFLWLRIYQLYFRVLQHFDPKMLLEVQALMQELDRKKDHQFIFDLRILQAHAYSKCRLFTEALKVLGENTAAAKNLFLRSEEIYSQCFIVRILYDAEMHQERLDHCLNFLNTYPDVEIEHRLFIYNILGGCYKWLGNLQQAIYYFELSVEQSRDLSNKSFFYRYATNLSNALVWNGQLERAQMYLDQIPVQDLLSDEQVLWHCQGAALLAWKKNDIQAALTWWDKAIKLGESRDDLSVVMIAIFQRRIEALREFQMYQMASDTAQECMTWMNRRNVQQQKMLSAGIRELVNVAVLQSENKILNENKSFLEKKVAERTQELQIEIEIRKQAELALQESNEQLEMRVLERTRDLHAAMDALAQKETLASLGRLVAGVAHELNTPIGNALLSNSSISVLIENFSTSIKAGSITRSSLNAMLNEIQIGIDINERALHRASDLVERFKEIAVLHKGETQQEFNLHTVLEYELARLHPNAQQTMVLECPNDLMCTNYLVAMGKVIHHLLSNALNHGLAGKPGKIILRAQQQSNDLILEVHDNGVGIEADLLTKIFTPFYTTAIGQGHVGLGLYMVHNICTGLFGGSLHVESQLGQGSVFQIRIPL